MQSEMDSEEEKEKKCNLFWLKIELNVYMLIKI